MEKNTNNNKNNNYKKKFNPKSKNGYKKNFHHKNFHKNNLKHKSVKIDKVQTTFVLPDEAPMNNFNIEKSDFKLTLMFLGGIILFLALMFVFK